MGRGKSRNRRSVQQKNNPPSQSDSQRIELSRTSVEYTTGPIPSPDAFQQYDEILPGAADRILEMAEKQSDHRMEWEQRALKWQNRI